MARPKNPNTKEAMKEVEDFFTNNFNRGHRRYTYIEFSENKQQAIDRFKLKIMILKDMGASCLKQCFAFKEDEIRLMIEEYPLRTLEIAEAEATDDIEIKTVQIDPTLSNEEILKKIQEARKNQDFGKGLFQSSSEREFGAKLADTLFIIDCKKFHLSNTFIQAELSKYNGYDIKTTTIQKYFNYAYEIYENIPTKI